MRWVCLVLSFVGTGCDDVMMGHLLSSHSACLSCVGVLATRQRASYSGADDVPGAVTFALLCNGSMLQFARLSAVHTNQAGIWKRCWTLDTAALRSHTACVQKASKRAMHTSLM